jgi:hypothetical protein
MRENILKRYPTIGCCGIDCGLCPRFYTEGKSKCPGCVGPNFFEKHPPCAIVTCCFKDKGFETCAECNMFPCEKMEKWDRADSFVTHRKAIINLKDIKNNGIKEFIEQQKVKMKILNKFIKEYDDGRSKSFFCLAAALISIEELNLVMNQMKAYEKKLLDKKQLAFYTREILDQIAKREGIELIVRKEKGR